MGPRSQEERRQAAEARALAAETALAAIGTMVDASEANQLGANNELETIVSELEAIAATWNSPHTGETTTRPPSPV